MLVFIYVCEDTPAPCRLAASQKLTYNHVKHSDSNLLSSNTKHVPPDKRFQWGTSLSALMVPLPMMPWALILVQTITDADSEL